MADLDLMPPAMPGERRPQKQPGFLRKFFLKEDEEPQPYEPFSSPHAPDAPEEIDLDEIKRKLQLDDDDHAPPMPRTDPTPESVPINEQDLLEMPSREPQESQEPPREEPLSSHHVQISDWTMEMAPSERQQRPDDAVMVEESPLPMESWDTELAVDAAGGEHHDAVDAHFAPIVKKAEQLERQAQEERHEALPAQVADWQLQEKEVPPEKYFILRNGHPVRSLRELTEALDFIDDATFAHHLNEYRNDFASWIHGVINNPELAEIVRLAQTREEVLAALVQHREAAQQRVEESARKGEQKVRKLQKVTGDIDSLREQLAQKSRALEEERRAATKRMKEALDSELRARLAKERAKLKEALAKEKKERVSAQKLQADAQRAFAEHEQLAKKLDDREQKAAERERTVAEQRAQLAHEKEEAGPLLQQAQKVRDDLEKIARHQKQVQEHVRQIAQREAAIDRAEAALKQREAKVTQDLTRSHEQQDRLAALKGEHDKRERAVASVEDDAKKVMAQAQQRMREAVAREKEATAKIAAETKKLEAVRKRIEGALKKVIASKKQAMRAKELREHLEKAILETKQDVVKEREEMQKEEYVSMRKAQADTTPIGQPGSRTDEDVLEIRQTDLYQKIEAARAALERSDLVTAKRIYNELRDEFPKQQLPPPDKSALYMTIRELYDDIHLAMLEQ
jgi:hypothetical protein